MGKGFWRNGFQKKIFDPQPKRLKGKIKITAPHNAAIRAKGTKMLNSVQSRYAWQRKNNAGWFFIQNAMEESFLIVMQFNLREQSPAHTKASNLFHIIPTVSCTVCQYSDTIQNSSPFILNFYTSQLRMVLNSTINIIL